MTHAAYVVLSFHNCSCALIETMCTYWNVESPCGTYQQSGIPAIEITKESAAEGSSEDEEATRRRPQVCDVCTVIDVLFMCWHRSLCSLLSILCGAPDHKFSLFVLLCCYLHVLDVRHYTGHVHTPQVSTRNFARQIGLRNRPHRALETDHNIRACAACLYGCLCMLSWLRLVRISFYTLLATSLSIHGFNKRHCYFSVNWKETLFVRYQYHWMRSMLWTMWLRDM